MTSILKNKLRLRPSILTLFVILTVPVFVTIVSATYLSNDKQAHASAQELIERFRVDAIENIQSVFDPIKSLVRTVAAIGNEYPDIYRDRRPLKYFHSVLLHSDKIVSVYIGRQDDGSFWQTRRIEPTVPIFDSLPPEGARFAYRWIDPLKGGVSVDHYSYFDTKGADLGLVEQATAYDPRERGWYRRAVIAGTVMITPPDVFAALGLIGFTVGAPFYSKGKVAGVAAIDITLDQFSEYLAQRKISRNTLSYILDQQGRVIANSDLTKSYASVNGQVELQHITSLQNELPAVAFAARPRQHEQQYSFNHAGHEYIASLTTLPADLGARWQLFVITPIDDFTSAFQENNKRLLIFGLLAVVLQIAVIYLLASVLSGPLEKLALKVSQIQDLEGEPAPPSRDSTIREIAVLAKAIDTLDVAVKSFASFVPVGLVKKLLESEQKLELGGHSRFLTVFFSDIESFSSLSEEVPSQELLLRVSAYLEIVTRSVNRELGTIDKFMGDGVMAFWGAPALLEDHAWRACVAAVRIQQEMDVLNAGWQSEGQKPLRARIGIHCDAVMVGNIGSKERMSYTVMGDGVNIAARLEGINKEYKTRICISHSMFKEAGERLCVRPIDDVAVKGRRSKVPIYELMGVFGAGAELEPNPAAIRLSQLTRLAYEAVVSDDFALALKRYGEILDEFPNDAVSLELVKRLAA